MTDIIDALYDAQPEDDAPPPEPETTPSSPTEKTERVAPFAVLTGVLLRPVLTFERLREVKNGHWWLVVLIAAIGVMAVAAMSSIVTAEASRTVFESQAGADAGVDSNSIDTFLIIGGVFGAVFAVIGLVITYAIRTGLAYGLSLALGGRADFKPILRVAIWSAFPEALGSIVAAAAMAATGELTAPGLSAALTVEQTREMPVLSALLSNIDLYTLWGAVLLALGVSTVARISKGRGALVSLIYYGLVIGVAVGIAALGATLAGGGAGQGGVLF